MTGLPVSHPNAPFAGGLQSRILHGESYTKSCPIWNRSGGGAAPARDLALPIIGRIPPRPNGDSRHRRAMPGAPPQRSSSFAQRDMIDWTLTEAATRAGLRDVALSLAHERLAMRPESAPNQRFLRQAAAIAA